jgi:hypothetical protein
VSIGAETPPGLQGPARVLPPGVQGPTGAVGDPSKPKAPRKPAATQKGKEKHNEPATKPPKPGKTRKTPQAIIRAERQPPIPKKPNQFPWHALRYPPVLRFILLRTNGTTVALDNVTNVTWEDNDAILTGNIQVQDTKIQNTHTLARIAQGDQIACQVDVHDGQGFKQIWLMRTKSAGLAYADGTRTFDLANDLQLLQQSEGVFRYTQLGKADLSGPAGHNPARKGGWTGHDIILDICDRFKVPVGGIYKAYPDQKIGRFYLAAPTSPLEAIRKVLNIEFNRFKRRLHVRWESGALYITPLRRSPQLRALGPTLIDAAFKSELRAEFASSLRLHSLPELQPGYVVKPGTPAPKKSKHQQTFVVRQSDSAVSRFGFVEKILWSSDARSSDDLVRDADGYLEVVAKPKKTLQLTTPGIPYLHRGDAIKLGLGDTALRNQIVWVSAITSTATVSQYLSTITVVFDDPYVNHSDLMKVWKLKATHDEAFGTRAHKLATWGQSPAGNNKADTPKNIFVPHGADDPAGSPESQTPAASGNQFG